MLMLAAGFGLLAALLFAARAFSRASVATLKALAVWIAALAGLSLACLLFLTGRGSAALGGLVLLGPLVWEAWQRHVDPPAHPRRRPRAAAPPP